MALDATRAMKIYDSTCLIVAKADARSKIVRDVEECDAAVSGSLFDVCRKRITTRWSEMSCRQPREFIRPRTHTTWHRADEPRFTYARGIFIELEVGAKCIELALVHDNVELATVYVWPADAGYIELQGLLLRSSVENLPYPRAGASLHQDCEGRNRALRTV